MKSNPTLRLQLPAMREVTSSVSCSAFSQEQLGHSPCCVRFGDKLSFNKVAKLMSEGRKRMTLFLRMRDISVAAILCLHFSNPIM